MTLDKILPFSKKLLSQILNEDSITIDATVGNGHDTIFLAKQSPKGFVYAFDVQAQAIQNSTDNLTKENISNVQLIHDSHATIESYLKEEHQYNIQAVLFNLGYLPGSDKSITTQSNSTIEAINASLKHLKTNGLCILAVYPGHPEGRIESEEVLEYTKSLNQKYYSVLKYEFINQDNFPPYLIVIEKKDAL